MVSFEFPHEDTIKDFKVTYKGKEVKVKYKVNKEGGFEKETASAGNKTYYVMDNAGNKSTCSINILTKNENKCENGYSLNSDGKCEKVTGSPTVKLGSWYVSSTTWTQNGTAVDNCAKANDNWTKCTITTFVGDSKTCDKETGRPITTCYKTVTKYRYRGVECSEGTQVGDKCVTYIEPTNSTIFYTE